MPTKLVQRGITRYDKDENISNGYMVRVTRDGVTHSKYFSDSKFKGKRKALAAARIAYDKLVDQLPPARTTKNVKTRRNQSGKVGVHLAETTAANGEVYGAYCASWKHGDGTRGKISFAFKKYGKKAAFKLACIARDLEETNREVVEKKYRKETGKDPVKSSARSTVAAPRKKASKKATKKKASKKATKATKKKVTKKKSAKKKKKKR